MFASVGVSEEQVFGDLYVAWLKDTGEKNTNDSLKLFREVMERGIGNRQIVLRKERLGANVTASLAALLHRSPLTRLDLHGNTLRDSGCEMISHLMRDMSNLVYLDLGANDIGSLGIQALSNVVASHAKLQTLILGSSQHDAYANCINATSATILLEGCIRSHTLRHLDLSGSMIGTNNVGVVGVRMSDTRGGYNVGPPSRRGNRPGSKCSNSSRSLSSTTGSLNARAISATKNSNGGNSNIGFQSCPVDVLTELIRSSSTLTTLKLREVHLTTNEALQIIYAAAQSSSFAFIDLSGNALTGEVGDAFGDLIRGRATMQNPSALHTILLSNNPIMVPHSGMPPPRLFSSLSSDFMIVRLHVDRCGIDDAAMKSLCHSLVTNGALQSLHLKDNAITETGAVMLASALCRHMLLQDVSLEGNMLRDEGVCAFAEMLKSNNTLLSLNLTHTWMGERGVVALGVSLVENKTLQRLHIGDNHFTHDAGDAFAALLESNRYLLRCGLRGNSIVHHTILRVEKITARNREAYRNIKRSELEKDVIRLHYQMYKLDEARTELDNLLQKKLELGRAMEAFELQFKQDKSDFARRERELREMLESCATQEERCVAEKARLNKELEDALQQMEADTEIMKERLEAESAVREKVEEEHRQLKAQLTDMSENGPQREAAKREKLQELNEDGNRWKSQRKEYRSTITELQAVVNQLREKANLSAKKQGKKQGKKK